MSKVIQHANGFSSFSHSSEGPGENLSLMFEVLAMQEMIRKDANRKEANRKYYLKNQAQIASSRKIKYQKEKPLAYRKEFLKCLGS